MSQKQSKFSRDIMEQKYSHDLPDGSKETWDQIAHRVATNVFSRVPAPPELIEKAERLIAQKKFIPGGRYLYASGRPFHQVQNCLLLRAEDSREGWADLMHRAGMALMTGAGIGVDYSLVRPRGSIIRKTGGTATGPLALMQMLNEIGRGIMQGGSRRSAIWAGLRWNHPDVIEFVQMKNWSKEVRALKEKDFNFPATMDGTNISVILDTEFFEAYNNDYCAFVTRMKIEDPDPMPIDWRHPNHALAHNVYWAVVRQMLKTAEPGFSIDIGENEGESLRNACTEVTSRDNDDICNLGSINMALIGSKEEMAEVVEVGTAFLLAGTTYSDVPYDAVADTRTKNRRLGLGLMGLHEWLLKHGKRYGPDTDLAEYLEIYKGSTPISWKWADAWGLSRPVKTRAIAPTGTIGIVAETTTGIEPILCVAYKRRYLKAMVMHYQYVVDPAAARLIENGVDPELIEDAYSLAEDVERRVAFQAWMQQYVDHAISSTINMPPWGTELNNDSRVQEFGEMLLKYLPQLRGVTCYPDGARGGQPLTPVKYSTAIKHLGEVFVEHGTQALNPFAMSDADAAKPLDVCDITKGGTCGS